MDRREAADGPGDPLPPLRTQAEGEDTAQGLAAVQLPEGQEVEAPQHQSCADEGLRGGRQAAEDSAAQKVCRRTRQQGERLPSIRKLLPAE